MNGEPCDLPYIDNGQYIYHCTPDSYNSTAILSCPTEFGNSTCADGRFLYAFNEKTSKFFEKPYSMSYHHIFNYLTKNFSISVG